MLSLAAVQPLLEQLGFSDTWVTNMLSQLIGVFDRHVEFFETAEEEDSEEQLQQGEALMQEEEDWQPPTFPLTLPTIPLDVAVSTALGCSAVALLWSGGRCTSLHSISSTSAGV